MQEEIILYYPADTSSTFKMEVRIGEDTVWLNRHQLSLLYGRDVKTIGKHINNALAEELKNISVVAKFATTGNDGKVYQVEHYSLDMIISVGYRVKSDKGIQFRIWANKVLKDYLLKGYAIHQRIDKIEQKIIHHDQQIEQLVNTALPPKEGIFYDGQIFDAYQFVSGIIKTAKNSIILIDNYIDETVLTLLAKRKKGVKIQIFTQKISKQLQLDIDKFNAQYEKIEVTVFEKSHDRFLIIDDKLIYHIGASLKDLGKKWFAFSKIALDVEQILSKLNVTQ